MCTVSFIQASNRFIITSNRDERQSRMQALPPAVYMHEDGWMLYPKDPNGGGTWIAAKHNGDSAVLLNGAFYPHQPAGAYHKSRGIVLLEILAHTNPVNGIGHYDCTGIEPFTLILFSQYRLYQLRWNGFEKKLEELPITGAYIWSSVTLYNNEVSSKKEKWFNDWYRHHPDVSHEDIMQFHKLAGYAEAAEELEMTLQNETATVSITSIAIYDSLVKMHYWDAFDDTNYNEVLPVNKCNETQ